MDFDGWFSHTNNIWQFVMRLLFQSNSKEIVLAKTFCVSKHYLVISAFPSFIILIEENVHDSREHKKWSALLDSSDKRHSA